MLLPAASSVTLSTPAVTWSLAVALTSRWWWWWRWCLWVVSCHKSVVSSKYSSSGTCCCYLLLLIAVVFGRCICCWWLFCDTVSNYLTVPTIMMRPTLKWAGGVPSEVEKTKYIPSADFDNLINGMHVSCAPLQWLSGYSMLVQTSDSLAFPGQHVCTRMSERDLL